LWGGGPAGTACGITLARAGIESTIYERGEPGKSKICGDALIADAQRELGTIGILDEVRREGFESRSIEFFGPENEFARVSLPTINLQRRVMDQMLRDRFEQLGGRIVYGAHIEGVNVTSDAVELRERNQHLLSKASVAVLATGTSVGLAKRLGFTYSQQPRVSIRGYVDRQIDATQFWFPADGKGYWWAFPVPNGTSNVGYYSFTSSDPPQKSLVPFLELLSVTHQDIQELSSWSTRTGLRRETNVGNRVLLAGENAHTTYEWTGEGIGKALESGRYAAQTIIEAKEPFDRNELARYDVLLGSHMVHLHDGYQRALRIFENPLIRRLAYKTLAESETARALVTDIFHEKKTLDQFLSWRTLFKKK